MTKPRDFCFSPRLCRFLKISWDGRPKCGLDIKAEESIAEEMKTYMSGDFDIKNINPAPYSERAKI